jgi:hypothetical protein
MAIPDEWDCQGADNPVCPYCGEEESDFWEVIADSGDHHCSSCNRPFFFEREVSVTYSTSPKMGPHQLDAFWQKQELLSVKE